MVSRWVLPTPDHRLSHSLTTHLSISPLTAQVLINRGCEDVETARKFLNPQLNELSDPHDIPGMDAAVERVYEAARNQERVLVYGDYDVDGAASTALLVRFLRSAGLDCDYYVPHRIAEGYGLNVEAISEFKKQGVGLIITVDCGVGAVDECLHAKACGIDMVVTDHHEPGEALAPAVAIVNPKLGDESNPCRDLAGVGVAFKLAWAVAKRFSTGQKMSDEFRQFMLNSLGLVALGTVADIVPLIGENRVLVKYGLTALANTPAPGLRALMDCARIRGNEITPRDVAFGLGPRLNAAGRMDNAELAVELMISDDTMRCHEIAATLDQHNIDRRKLQNDIFEHAREVFLSQPGSESAQAIVLAHKDWHPGVIGIVASKMVDEFNCPSALIAINGDVGKASARSVPGFNLFSTLEGFSDRLLSFGGHAMAAGFQIHVDQIDPLRTFLNEAASTYDPEMFHPTVDVDAEIELADLSERLLSELRQLTPHGAANRPPLFVAHGLRIAGRPRLMGLKGRHVSFYVSDGRQSFRAVAFGQGDTLYDEILASERNCSIVFSPRVDTRMDDGALELRIEDIRLD
jgi:single-stranded-DNA-specific exonuclease